MNRTPQHPVVAVVLMAVLLTATGCSCTDRSEPARYPVSGTVTLDGKPLPAGRIIFQTVSLGLIDSMPIEDGRFSGRAVAGERRVQVSVIEDRKFTGLPMPGVKQPETVATETLPARYNVASTLTATVQESGPNEFAFELTSD